MGLTTNPDDKNLVDWLVGKWHLMPKHFELNILQHPKFSFHVETELANINVRKFDYLDSGLDEYYMFLSSQDLVICGGTSVILDCLFTKVPVIVTNFEIEKQSYWYSSLRYFDYYDHTRELFSRFEFSFANSGEQLVELLRARKLPQLEETEFGYFIGDSGTDPAKSLIDAIASLLSKR